MTVLGTGCGQSFTNYFSKTAIAASLQVGVLNATSSTSSFVALQGYDFGQQPFGSNTTQSFYLVNQGELPGTDLTFAIDSPHYSFQTKCKSIPASSNSPQACQINITFTPTAFDSLPANLTYTYANSKGQTVTGTLPITAVSMPWAYLAFTPNSNVESIASSNQPQTFFVHVTYSGDLLKSQGGNSLITIPPASWTSAMALEVTTQSANQTVPTVQAFTPASVFSFNAAATAASPTGCVSPITKGCDIAIQFNPSFSGITATPLTQADFMGQIGLHYFNGHSANAYAGTTLLAHGLSSANFAPYATSNVNAGTVAYNPTQPQTIQVKVTNPNLSTQPGTQVSITLPKTSAYQQTAADLSASTCINGGQISTSGCIVQLTFNPQVATLPSGTTSYSDSLKISYYLGTQLETLTSSLTGIGAPPANLVFTDSNGNLLPSSSLNFGTPPAFYAATQSVVIKNTGGVGTLLTLTSPSDKSFTLSGCSNTTLNANSSCTLQVTFTAPDVNTLHQSTSQISYLSGSTTSNPTPLVSSFAGTGSSAALVIPSGGTYPTSDTPNGNGSTTYSASSDTINLGIFVYGTASQSSGSKTIALSIYGTSAIPNGLSVPNNGNGFSFSSTDCFKAIAAPNGGASTCHLTITYTAPSSGNAASFPTDTTTLSYTDSSNNKGSIFLTVGATAAPPPNVHYAIQGTTTGNQGSPYVISTSALPTVTGQTNSLALTLWNDSAYLPVTLVSPTIQGGSTSKFTVNSNSCGTTIAANSSCNYSVQFTPKTSDSGSFADNIQIKYTNAATGIVSSYLYQAINAYASTQISPQPAISPMAINFGTIYPGQNLTSTLNFTPVGYSASPWWISLTPLPSKVSIQSNTCSTSNGEGTPCSVTFVYSPSSVNDSLAGSNSAKLTYQQNATTQATLPVSFTANLQSSSATINISQTNLGKYYVQSPDPLIPTSGSANVIIKNTASGSSGAMANFQSVALTSPDGSFSLNQNTSDSLNCTSNLALNPSGGSCNIQIKFAPKSVGTSTATLTISYADQGLGKTITQSTSLTGTGTTPIHVAAGGGTTCIADETQQGVCWGDNTYGQLGQGNTNAISTPPQQMAKINFGNGTKVVKMAVSSQHVCALVNTPTAQGAITCWGSNDSGRLGLELGTSGVYSAPILNNGALSLVQLVNSSGAAQVATDISAGYGHVCALFSDQTMKCWGLNSSYQLGNATTTAIGSSASQMGTNLESVPLTGKITAISAGTSHTCAVLASGVTQCWGDNGYGELGRGNNNLTAATPAAVNVGNFPAATSVKTATLNAITCILFNNGHTTCFGQSEYSSGSDNFYGTLGVCWARPNNDYSQSASLCWNSPSSTPTDKFGVLGSDVGSGLIALPFTLGVSSLSLGGQHGCALFSTGSNGGCWGSNTYGQLGNGHNNNVGANQTDLTTGFTNSFIPVPGHTPLELATGAAHSCAVFTDNTVKCWGEGSSDNANGQGKDTNSVADQLSPVYTGN